MRALLALAIVTAATTAAAAPYELSVGSTTRALPGADPVTADSLAGGGLGAGRRLDLELPSHLELWTDAGIQWAGANGAMFQTLTTEVFSTTLTAGAHLRYHPFHAVAVAGAVALGYQHASLAITDSKGHEASDTGWAPVARASLQVDLLAIDLPRFALGLRAELGYLAAVGVAMTPRPERTGDDDTLYLPMTEASVGHLDLGGPFFSFGLVSQF